MFTRGLNWRRHWLVRAGNGRARLVLLVFGLVWNGGRLVRLVSGVEHPVGYLREQAAGG